MLLEHLKLWRTWNETKHGPFYKNIDVKNVRFDGPLERRGSRSTAPPHRKAYISGFWDAILHTRDDYLALF
jgi:hypothetical protein